MTNETMKNAQPLRSVCLRVAGMALLLLTLPGWLGAAVLPSWNQGEPRDSIIAFVERVSDPNGADFVPTDERIAVFDNDGNLWSEKPAYFQLLFAIDRVKAMAPQHPEWKDTPP